MAEEMDRAALYVDALQCGIAAWWKIWGDPLLSGTIFVASYLGVAALVLNLSSRTAGRERCLWRLCGFLFIFQALNTPLDLHALPGTFGRCLAHAQGWYESRAHVQLIFLIGIAVCALLSLVVFRRNLLNNSLLVLGVAIAMGNTIIKGVDYHGTERILGANFGPLRGADLIEFSGISIAALVALRRRSGKLSRHPHNL